MTDGFPRGERPNVALVVLDTLRKDAFDEHFDWLPGRRFENAWSPGHWTVPAHGSLFTGRYPSETGVHARSPAFDYPGDVLAERLTRAGYVTRGFSCNVNITPQMEFDRGFDHFTGNWRVRALGEDLFDWGSFSTESRRTGLPLYLEGVYRCLRSDSPTVPSLKRGALLKLRDLDLNGALIDDGAQKVLSYVESTDFGDGEFLFLNLMEAHSPYLPPRGYRSVPRVDVDGIRATLGEPTAGRELVRRAYDDSVRYLSDIYRDIYEELSASFDYVVTLSDHGELLGEHGAWDHLYGVYPELTHVPLVLDGPGLSGRSDATVSLRDVPRTVLDIADCDTKGWAGRSLLDVTAGEPVLTEYHGLTQTMRRSVTDEYAREVERMDRELRGLAAPDDYYGYETPEGFVETGEYDRNGDESGDDPRTALTTLIERLDVRDVDSTDYADELKSHLADLGYV